MMSDLTAYVMAGGKSTRFGEPKALADFNGKRLLDYALNLAFELTDRVVVGVEKGNPCRVDHAEVLEDKVEGAGPVGGVYSALSTLNHGWVAVIPFFCHISRLRPWNLIKPISDVASDNGGILDLNPCGSSTQT